MFWFEPNLDISGNRSSAASPSEVSPLDKNASKLFVFSADKHLKEGDLEESDKAEELISPFPTFEERQAYFNEQILIQEAEALKGKIILFKDCVPDLIQALSACYDERRLSVHFPAI